VIVSAIEKKVHMNMCLVLNGYRIQLFESTNKQDRQCSYKVTLRRLHETIVEVENKYYIF